MGVWLELLRLSAVVDLVVVGPEIGESLLDAEGRETSGCVAVPTLLHYLAQHTQVLE